MTDKDKDYGCLLMLIGLIAAAPLCIWSGYVLTILWGWFIVPTFNLPQLPISTAIGISIVCGYLCKQDATNHNDSRSSEEKMMYELMYVIIRPALALATGWAVTLFM